MTTLNLSLSSPTTSSGYGSEDDHSPIFLFPALPGGTTADRRLASPSSDQVTSRVSGGSKFNELEEEEEEEEDDDINIDIFGEICEYLELDEDGGFLLTDCDECPGISSAEFLSSRAKTEDKEPAQELHGKNSICLARGVKSLSERNKNSLNQIISSATESGDWSKNSTLVDCSNVTPQNSMTNQCNNHTALKLSKDPSREEISEDFLMVTSVQSSADPKSEYSNKSITPESSDHYISSSTTGIGDEDNPAKPRHQSRQISIRLATGNQRRKPVNQNEVPPPTSSSDKRKRHHELDDHRYFSPAPRNEDQLPVPVKVPKTSLDLTGSGATGRGSSRRSEKSILETFLLTKETLNANKGSDGMLEEDNIARLYTGDQDSSRPASSSSSSSTSVLERILTGTSRCIPGDFASEQCSSTATPIDSPGGDRETATSPPSESDINYEIFNENNCKYDSNSILLEFFCEKLDDEVWTPSGDNGKVFSNEMDAIINSQASNNQNDVWIHQYISDLL